VWQYLNLDIGEQLGIEVIFEMLDDTRYFTKNLLYFFRFIFRKMNWSSGNSLKNKLKNIMVHRNMKFDDKEIDSMSIHKICVLIRFYEINYKNIFDKNNSWYKQIFLKNI